MQGAVRLDRAERLIGTRLGQSQQIFRRGMQGRGYVRESARRGLPISREVFRDVRLGRPGPCSELGLVDTMPRMSLRILSPSIAVIRMSFAFWVMAFLLALLNQNRHKRVYKTNGWDIVASRRSDQPLA